MAEFRINLPAVYVGSIVHAGGYVWRVVEAEPCSGWAHLTRTTGTLSAQKPIDAWLDLESTDWWVIHPHGSPGIEPLSAWGQPLEPEAQRAWFKSEGIFVGYDGPTPEGIWFVVAEQDGAWWWTSLLDAYMSVHGADHERRESRVLANCEGPYDSEATATRAAYAVARKTCLAHDIPLRKFR